MSIICPDEDDAEERGVGNKVDSGDGRGGGLRSADRNKERGSDLICWRRAAASTAAVIAY